MKLRLNKDFSNMENLNLKKATQLLGCTDKEEHGHAAFCMDLLLRRQCFPKRTLNLTTTSLQGSSGKWAAALYVMS